MELPPYLDRSSSSGSENIISDNTSYTKTHNLIRWKSGKRVDPRLLTLLESFGEIYIRRHDFFRKIFQGNHEELFKKMGNALKKKKQMKKSKSLPRSTSMRTVRERGVVVDEADGVRLARFKVRTPNVIVAGSDDGKGGDTQIASGSNGSRKK